MVEQCLRVGAAAEAVGVNVQTLHYYERRGLLRPRARNGAGYRQYGERELRRVRGIKRAQSLGFTLAEIQEFIAVAESRRSARTVAALARGKLAEIDQKIRALELVRATLNEAIETCACGGDLRHCDVIAGLGDPHD
jgi:DNA-binding transcriptional MerR regulator